MDRTKRKRSSLAAPSRTKKSKAASSVSVVTDSMLSQPNSVVAIQAFQDDPASLPSFSLELVPDVALLAILQMLSLRQQLRIRATSRRFYVLVARTLTCDVFSLCRMFGCASDASTSGFSLKLRMQTLAVRKNISRWILAYLGRNLRGLRLTERDHALRNNIACCHLTKHPGLEGYVLDRLYTMPPFEKVTVLDHSTMAVDTETEAVKIASAFPNVSNLRLSTLDACLLKHFLKLKKLSVGDLFPNAEYNMADGIYSGMEVSDDVVGRFAGLAEFALGRLPSGKFMSYGRSSSCKLIPFITSITVEGMAYPPGQSTSMLLFKTLDLSEGLMNNFTSIGDGDVNFPRLQQICITHTDQYTSNGWKFNFSACVPLQHSLIHLELCPRVAQVYSENLCHLDKLTRIQVFRCSVRLSHLKFLYHWPHLRILSVQVASLKDLEALHTAAPLTVLEARVSLLLGLPRNDAIHYQGPNLLRFFAKQRRYALESVTLCHFLTADRDGLPPPVSSVVQDSNRLVSFSCDDVVFFMRHHVTTLRRLLIGQIHWMKQPLFEHLTKAGDIHGGSGTVVLKEFGVCDTVICAPGALGKFVDDRMVWMAEMERTMGSLAGEALELKIGYSSRSVQMKKAVKLINPVKWRNAGVFLCDYFAGCAK